MLAGYKTVSNKILQRPYLIMLNKGLDESAIYRKTGVSRADVFSDKGRVNYPRYMSFLQFVHNTKLLLFESTMFNVSLSQYMEDFGELFGLCLNCATAREAISQFMRYRVIIGEPDLILFNQENDRAIIQYITEEVTELSSVHALANFIVIYRLLQFYVQDDTVKANAWFMGEPWFDKDEYADGFKGHLRFNQDFNRIEFDAALLDSRSTVFNPLLLPYLEVQVKNEMLLLLAKKSYSAKVHDKVKELLQGGGREKELSELSVDTVSKHFSVSRWTLGRKLAEEGVSYQKIISDIRREEAVKFLSDTRLAVGEISARLGFSSQGAFSRFFSQHFGLTPKAYRMAITQWQA